MRNIKLQDRERGIYQFYLRQKDNNIANVLKYLFLRKDFYELLDKIYDSFIFREKSNFPDKKIWDYNDPVFQELIYEYIDKLENTKYCQKLNEKEDSRFRSAIFHFINSVYTLHFFNVRNKSPLKEQIILDSLDNYPTIGHNCFNADTFHEVFNDAFYSKKSLDKFKNTKKKHPTSITIGGGPAKADSNFVEEKIIQVRIKEGTTKQTLIDYINKNWSDIDWHLHGGRPEIPKTKSKADKNFIRDIEIYNKYQEFAGEDEDNPETRTWTWLKDESEYNLELEPNTIAKIVSDLNKEIEEINSEK